jgi:hypothetical protein
MNENRVRHLKRGTTYVVIGKAYVEASKPISEGEKVTVYRSEFGGVLWVRPTCEFEDGRFEEFPFSATKEVTPPTSIPHQEWDAGGTRSDTGDVTLSRADFDHMKANLAQALWELDKANAELARMAAKRDTARLLLAQAQRERDEARSENDKLRGLLAKSDKDCPYCGLPAAEISKCEQGFPGCGRMDDIISAQGTKAEADLAAIDAVLREPDAPNIDYAE